MRAVQKVEIAAILATRDDWTGRGFSITCSFFLSVRGLHRAQFMEHEADINHRIWQVIALIPEGKVATYGDVANHAGLARAARRVGRALRQLPSDTRIPWHRVINAQGRISLPPDSASQYTQRERLEAEGVVFKSNKAVDLKTFRWKPEEY